MNKRFIFIIMMSFVLIVGSAAYFSNFIRDRTAIELVIDRQKRSSLDALNQITTSVREDLIQGNVRQARNILERVKNDVLFVDYAIKSGGFTEVSTGFEATSRSEDNFVTTIPVEFSEGGEKWGQIDFVVPKRFIADLESSLRLTLFSATMVVSVTTFIVLSSLFFLLWSSSGFLSEELKSMLRRQTRTSTGILRTIWHPTLSSFSEIAETNAELNESLSRAESEAALYRLSTQVAHDIRAPLSALQIATAKSPSTDESQNLMQSAIKRITQIADDLMNAERSRIRARSPSVQVSSVVQSVFLEAKVNAEIAQKSISLSIQDPDSSFATVSETDLARCVSNLIANALEEPTSKNVRIIVEGSKSIVRVSVLDDGAGIPSHVISKIGVVRFSHGKSGAGTGLGLFHASQFAKTSGGDLKVESSLGKGARITIELPPNQDRNASAASAAE